MSADRLSATRLCDHTIRCGDWVLHARGVLPVDLCTVRFRRCGPGEGDGMRAVWVEVFGPDDMTPVVVLAEWSPAPDADCWIQGELFEAFAGPLGVGCVMRPIVMAALDSLCSAVTTLSADLPRASDGLALLLRRVEASARRAQPREFAVIAAATRALQPEVDPDERSEETAN